MDNLLMLRGEARHCDDCDTATVFLPLEDAAPDAIWICTVCDAAVLLLGRLSAAA